MGTTMETGLRHRVPQEIWTAVAIFAKFSRDMREGGAFCMACALSRGVCRYPKSLGLKRTMAQCLRHSLLPQRTKVLFPEH